MGNRGAASGKSGTGGTFNEVSDDHIFDRSVDKWKQDITYDEKEDVIRYTDTLYSSLNHTLRQGNPEGYYESEIKNLDSALGKFNLSKNIVTYRGVSSDAFGDLTPKTGMIITDKGYMSTSVSKKVAEGFDKGYILRINVPKGKGRGAYVKSVSVFSTENEFLMPRNTSLKINKVVSGDSLGFYGGQQVIYADIV